MTNLLMVLQFILTAILTGAVLLQKSSSIGLGSYSGSNESLFGAKGPASFMTKFTAIAATAFIINTLTLGYLYNQERKVSLAEEIKLEKSVVPSTTPAPMTSAPSAPEAPSSK